MIKYIFLIAFLVISGCGRNPHVLTTPSCVAEPTTGGANIRCPDGSSAFVPNGINGINGVNGTNGQDATPLTTIKFCPNVQTTYPTLFPEYGICINNTIYAVFWDNTRSWLGQVVPGTYLSTATGSQCTFTVLPNCLIQ